MRKINVLILLTMMFTNTLTAQQNTDFIDLIRQATKAPSGHNAQPWLFKIKTDGIEIYADTTRRLPVVDPHDRELFVSLGCAVENLLFGGVRSFLRTGVFGIRRYIRIHISWQRGTDGKCRLCRRAEKLDEIQQATSRPTSRRTKLRYLRSSQPAEVYSQSLYIDSYQHQDTKQNR